MPIVNQPVKPHVNNPYRGKLDKAGGLRLPDDWRRVMVHMRSNNSHLVCHDQSCFDEVIIEIHDETSLDGTHELEFCRMEEFALDRDQRFELAIYLLSTI